MSLHALSNGRGEERRMFVRRRREDNGRWRSNWGGKTDSFGSHPPDRGEIPLALLWSSQVNAPVTNAPCSSSFITRTRRDRRLRVHALVSERTSVDISRARYLGQTGSSNVRLFPCLSLRARLKEEEKKKKGKKKKCWKNTAATSTDRCVALCSVSPEATTPWRLEKVASVRRQSNRKSLKSRKRVLWIGKYSLCINMVQHSLRIQFGCRLELIRIHLDCWVYDEIHQFHSFRNKIEGTKNWAEIYFHC